MAALLQIEKKQQLNTQYNKRIKVDVKQLDFENNILCNTYLKNYHLLEKFVKHVFALIY